MKRAAALAVIGWLSAACSLGPVGSWRSAAAPPTAIGFLSTAVPLGQDRIAVFGGVALETGQPTGSTLIYDAVANRWTKAAPAPEPRFGDAIAVLHDGEVLDAGGYGPNEPGNVPVIASTYLYEPNADSWRRAGDLPIATAAADSVTLEDGRVLLVGGTVALPKPEFLPGGGIQLVQDTASSELFDPGSGTWSPAGALSSLRSGEAVAALPGGGALAAGGCIAATHAPPAAVDTVEIFDAPTRSWRPAAPLPEPRCGAAAIALAGGRVLVVGGQDQPGSELQDAVVFDPRSGSWRSAGRLATTTTPIPVNGRGLIWAASLTDHRVMLPLAEPGGQVGSLTTTVIGGQLFDPASGSWSFVTSTSAVTTARFGSPQVIGTATLSSNRMLILLENNALIFDADAPPPQTALLDSSSLTTALLAIIAALLLAIAIGYVGGRARG